MVFLFNDTVLWTKVSFRRMCNAIMQYNSVPLSGFDMFL